VDERPSVSTALYLAATRDDIEGNIVDRFGLRP